MSNNNLQQQNELKQNIWFPGQYSTLNKQIELYVNHLKFCNEVISSSFDLGPNFLGFLSSLLCDRVLHTNESKSEESKSECLHGVSVGRQLSRRMREARSECRPSPGQSNSALADTWARDLTRIKPGYTASNRVSGISAIRLPAETEQRQHIFSSLFYLRLTYFESGERTFWHAHDL